MTARTPLYYDGSGSLIELSAAEIVEYQRQAIKQYADNPSVTVSVVSSSGTISPQMDDTRLRSSADTFIKPAIDLMVASSEAVAGDYGGTFTIHNSNSLSNHTLVSSTAVFIDTRADTGSFSADQIGSSGSFQDHSTNVNEFFLHRRDAVDNSPARTLLFIDNSSNNLNQYSEADIESLLQEYIRKLAVDDDVAADHQIDYNINGSGDDRGTAMTDTRLDGSGTETNRFVGADDYRSQKFPNGSAGTISTFTFKINKS
jgi:hypothetical protein